MERGTDKRVGVNATGCREGLLPPPVGTSDWARFSRTSYCVDKTLLIKDLIDSESTVVLFTRPRRFGKTTALEMIRAFYEDEASLFHDKKIWAAGERYRKEQGTHPVVFLSFKDVKWRTFGESIRFMGSLLASCVGKFAKAVEALELEAERERLTRVMREKGDEQDLAQSLGLLCKAVHPAFAEHGQRFCHGQKLQRFKILRPPLRNGVKGSHRIDFIAEKFYPYCVFSS